MALTELLAARRDRIVEEALAALDRAHLAHYEATDEPERRERLTALYDLAAEAVTSRNLTRLLHHAERVARARFADGYDLTEVQTAFNVLEERLWSALVEELPPAELARAVGLVGTALGAGKDRLAATYVELVSRGRVPTLDLAALFAGTAGG